MQIFQVLDKFNRQNNSTKPLLCAGRFISTKFNLKTMQVIKKEKQMKEVDVTIESYSLCDKCNEKIKTGSYDAFECEFTHKTGDSYPEGGSGELQEMELCQKCAVEFVELLRQNGYRVNDSEWDW